MTKKLTKKQVFEAVIDVIPMAHDYAMDHCGGLYDYEVEKEGSCYLEYVPHTFRVALNACVKHRTAWLLGDSLRYKFRREVYNEKIIRLMWKFLNLPFGSDNVFYMHSAKHIVYFVQKLTAPRKKPQKRRMKLPPVKVAHVRAATTWEISGWAKRHGFDFEVKK